MAVTRTATDVEVAYTTQDLVAQYLPSGSILAEGETAPNCVTTADLATMMIDESREIDGILGSVGFDVPFPASGATDPQLPRVIEKLATFRVVAEVRSQVAQGNRKRAGATWYEEKAQQILDGLIERPHSIGKARRSSPDDCLTKVMGQSSAQYGLFMGSYYRLQNRNISVNSLRWVTSAGVETSATDGRPWTRGIDWDVYDAAQGILIIPGSAQILAVVGAGGGCVYEFSWMRLDWGQTNAGRIPGVSTL